jgi:RNA polymerase sigma-70 factor (ECF subfamily)
MTSSCLKTPDPLIGQLLEVATSLRRFAISLSRDHSRADDLVQETLVKAWKSRSAFVQGTNLKAWLFTILRNTFLSELRKHRAEVEDPDDALANRAFSGASQDGHMELADFARAYGELPFEQREALYLIGADGYSYNEAALMCGCAVGTVKSRVNRARVKLRELLDVNGLPEYGAPSRARHELEPSHSVDLR